MKTNLRLSRYSNLTTVAIFFSIFFLICTGCGGGGGGDDDSVNNLGPSDQDVDLSSLPLTKGGSKQLSSNDNEVDGASLFVPPGSTSQDASLSLSASGLLPADSPYGQTPVGKLFDILPSGVQFEVGNEALLLLPVPPGESADNLYIGRWNESNELWENLEGQIDGDFISTEIEHLSLYGLFYRGKSLVKIINNMDPDDDPTDSGIDIEHVSGPVPTLDTLNSDPFPAYRPMPARDINLKIGEFILINFLPGQYKFEVAYPSPSPVTNDLNFSIPRLQQGSDDGDVDQTISITLQGASSTDTDTDESIDFSGRVIVLGSDPPTIQCTANVPPGVVITSIDPSDPTLPSRRVSIGPIYIEQLNSTAVELVGTATDPEGSAIDLFWTWSTGTLPTIDDASSGETIGRYFRPNPEREGVRNIYLTAYDDSGKFDECRWTITVEANANPTIDVIVDDTIIDYGRLGLDRMNGSSAIDRGNLPAPPTGFDWCDYEDIDADGTGDRTYLKGLPILPASENPDHPNRPTQYPLGMTCVYAIVGDTDGDPLMSRFRFPHAGDIYNALTGAKITTVDQLDAYNDLLSATTTTFPVPPILASSAPAGLFALPIIWEAPDNVTSTLPSITTHDCRHIPVDSSGGGPCVDIPGSFPDGGVISIVATTTDRFSREQIGFGLVGYGEDDIVRLTVDNDDDDGDGGSGENKPPTCSSTSISTDQDESVSIDLIGSDPDGDSLTYKITTQPTNGNLSGDTYTPDSGYFGPDSLTFVVNDGSSDSAPCTVNITVDEAVEERKWYVFKLSGVGYHKTYGAASKVTGFEYQALWLFPSEVDGIVGTDFDNTAACANGPWPGPVLAPTIWQTRSMVKTIGPLDSYDDLASYRCPVPNWVYNNPICNQWVFESDDAFYDDIDSLCQN